MELRCNDRPYRPHEDTQSTLDGRSSYVVPTGDSIIIIIIIILLHSAIQKKSHKPKSTFLDHRIAHSGTSTIGVTYRYRSMTCAITPWYWFKSLAALLSFSLDPSAKGTYFQCCICFHLRGGILKQELSYCWDGGAMQHKSNCCFRVGVSLLTHSFSILCGIWLQCCRELDSLYHTFTAYSIDLTWTTLA